MPLHTINIPIPSEITRNIRSLFDKLNSKYRNKYFADQNWNPHIGLVTTQVTQENSQEYLRKVEEISKKIKPFEITLDLILPSPNYKYIWINVNQDSKKKITDIHKLLQNELEVYREKNIPQYFQKKWDRIPEKIKIKIMQTGEIHDYFPHISIVKLTPKETQKAIIGIERRIFKDKSFSVNKLEVTKQSFVPENMFPIVKEIRL